MLARRRQLISSLSSHPSGASQGISNSEKVETSSSTSCLELILYWVVGLGGRMKALFSVLSGMSSSTGIFWPNRPESNRVTAYLVVSIFSRIFSNKVKSFSYFGESLGQVIR